MMKGIKEKLHILKHWKNLLFDYPPLTLEEENYDEYWKSKRGKDIGALSDWQKERAQFVVNTLKKSPPVSILDIACGDGSILNFIKNNLHVTKLIGADISKFALDKAKEFGIEIFLVDTFKDGELEKLPKTDYVLLFEILEHTPRAESLLQHAYEKANRGVFFSFPNTGFFPHRYRLLFGKFPMQWRLFPGEHVRFWTKKDLIWWLNELGYEGYEINYYKGVQCLNKLWPSMFAAGFVVFIPKGYNGQTS